MIKKFIIRILQEIRYLVFLPFVFIIGLIILPLSLFSKWNGMLILSIAHHEWCSLSKAKKLLEEDKDGKYLKIFALKNSSLDNNPAYANLYTNIFHKFR